MSNQDEIRAAIAAHSLWRTRLRAAIESGRSEWNVEHVARPDQCELGRWLARLAPDESNRERADRVRQLHGKFHAEASKVLELAHSGQGSVAALAMAAGSPFDRLTNELTRELMLWARVA
ncbi:MAG: CZB domain-containing protein [Candidatus Eisenbacteria bacterium]